MTIKVGQNAQGHHTHAMQRARIPVQPDPSPKHVGITRSTRKRVAKDLPTSQRHEQVLAAMGDELISATALARELEMSKDGLTASLYALADRGLVERVPYKGWRRV
jgi:predicted Rossmann fold nucleotide-binding protein DprA/Smf involved in DNA uptake